MLRHWTSMPCSSVNVWAGLEGLWGAMHILLHCGPCLKSNSSSRTMMSEEDFAKTLFVQKRIGPTSTNTSHWANATLLLEMMLSKGQK